MVISSPCQSVNTYLVNDFPCLDIRLPMNWLLCFLLLLFFPCINLIHHECYCLENYYIFAWIIISTMFLTCSLPPISSFVQCHCFISKGHILQHAIEHSIVWFLGATFYPPVNVSSLTSGPLCMCSVFYLQHFSFQSMLIMPYPSIKLQLSYYILSELFSQPKIIFSSQQIRPQHN